MAAILSRRRWVKLQTTENDATRKAPEYTGLYDIDISRCINTFSLNVSKGHLWFYTLFVYVWLAIFGPQAITYTLLTRH